MTYHSQARHILHDYPERDRHMADKDNKSAAEAPAAEVQPEALTEAEAPAEAATTAFTPVAIDELPKRSRTATISEDDRTAAVAVAAILAAGQAARSGASYPEKKLATTAGVKLAGVVGKLSLYGGKLTVRTLPLADGSWTYAILPKEDTAEEAPATT